MLNPSRLLQRVGHQTGACTETPGRCCGSSGLAGGERRGAALLPNLLYRREASPQNVLTPQAGVSAFCSFEADPPGSPRKAALPSPPSPSRASPAVPVEAAARGQGAGTPRPGGLAAEYQRGAGSSPRAALQNSGQGQNPRREPAVPAAQTAGAEGRASPHPGEPAPNFQAGSSTRSTAQGNAGRAQQGAKKCKPGPDSGRSCRRFGDLSAPTASLSLSSFTSANIHRKRKPPCGKRG